MSVNDQVKHCCVYGLEAKQIFRNFQLQDIKSYGHSVILEDGMVLYRMGKDADPFRETDERTLCRCVKCGALFLEDYHYEYDMYDAWAGSSLYPVSSEEEADLLNLLMDGKETGLPDFRRPYRDGWNYRWIGEEDPRPLDAEELKGRIREKYADVNRELLENLIRNAGQERMCERTPMPVPEPEKEEETEKNYQYMVHWDHGFPTLIRLGSLAKLEADMFVYPGVWEDTPHLNDIRVGQGCYMDYDDISEKEAMEIQAKLQAAFDRKAAEGKK